MAIITTGTNPKMLWPGINAIFGSAYAEHAPEYKDLVDIFTSARAYEEDLQVDRFGLAVIKPEAQAISFDTEKQGYVSRYVHVVYGLGYIVTREEQEDNLYMDKARPRTRSLAFSMHQTKEIVVANLYNRATNSSYTFGDGVTMLSASHPTNAGNQANVLAASADFSQAALEDFMILISRTKDGRGLYIPNNAKTLVIPPDLMWEANRVLGSILQSNTAENAINVVRNLLDIKVNRYLTDTNAFFIRTDMNDSLKLFQRRPLEFTQDNDWHTENHLYKATERYSVGMSDWRGIFGSPGAS